MTLVDKAIALLREKDFHARSSFDAALVHLAGFPAFEALEEDELEEITAEALARLPGAVKAPARPAGGSRSARHPAGAPVGPTRSRTVSPDLKPSAPFRFVILPDQVALADTPLVDYDTPVPDGFCARIQVTWAAETPLLIGEQTDETAPVQPLRLGPGGPYAIPGATLRGMLRAAVEIVAHGRLGTANFHHRYGLRDFDHPAYADRSPVSRVDEVKAGWLRPTADGAWQITPCDWAHILITDLLADTRGNPAGDDARSTWIQQGLEDKYRRFGMLDESRRTTFDTPRHVFSDAPKDNNRRLVRLGHDRPGTLVFSNKLPGRGGKKKFEYVLFEPTPEQKNEAAVITPDIVAMFERLYSKPSKNRPAPDGSWKLLKPILEAKGRLPVFYVGDLARQEEGFFFGLTRLFKIPHEQSVGDVLKRQNAHTPEVPRNANNEVTGYAPDFVEALFGYVMEADALGLERGTRMAPDLAGRKGRVAVSFARLDPAGQPVTVSTPVRTVMMAPRASFAPFYLKSPAEKDYSADGQAVRLAGRKRYLPRRQDGQAPADVLKGIEAMGQAQIDAIEQASRRPVSRDVQSHLRFLLPKGDRELTFTGELRLHNVTAAELGAVLFALTHGGDPQKPCRHMIGRAKPFGAGQMRVVSACVSVVANSKSDDRIRPPEPDELATPDGRAGFCPPPGPGQAATDNASHRPFLNAFIAHMKSKTGLETFPDVPAVREFLGVSDPTLTNRLAGALAYLPLPLFNALRDATKPLKPSQNGTPAAPSHTFAAESPDGRLLPAPTAPVTPR